MIDISAVYKEAQSYIEAYTCIDVQPFSQAPFASVPVIALNVCSDTYKSSIMREELATINIKCLVCCKNYITDCGNMGVLDVSALLDEAMNVRGYTKNGTPPYRDARGNWCAIISYSKHSNKF